MLKYESTINHCFALLNGFSGCLSNYFLNCCILCDLFIPGDYIFKIGSLLSQYASKAALNRF